MLKASISSEPSRSATGRPGLCSLARPKPGSAPRRVSLHRLDADQEELAHQLERLAEGRAGLLEELARRLQLHLPRVEVDCGGLVDLLVGDVEAREIEVARLGHPAEGRLLAAHPQAGAVDDPLEDAHVLAEAG